MTKKNKIVIVLSLILAFALGVFAEYVYLDVPKYTTEKKLFGSFGINTDKLDALYFVIEDEDTFLWYNQQDFLVMGTYKQINDSNVYSFKYDDEQVYGVYYEDELLLIGEDYTESYPLVSRIILHVGIHDRYNAYMENLGINE